MYFALSYEIRYVSFEIGLFSNVFKSKESYFVNVRDDA